MITELDLADCAAVNKKAVTELDEIRKFRAEANQKLLATKYRLLAVYHNCHSSAAFARYDAAMAENNQDCHTHTKEAISYEVCAGWVKAEIDNLPIL
jgi:hypothetical protein